MTDIYDTMHRTGSAVTTTGGDPYAAYGAKVGTQGTFLSFQNGEFQAGQDKTELPVGTRLVANMPGLRVGWQRWSGGRVVEDRTQLLTDRIEPASRDTLGYDDESLWERPEPTKARPNPDARDPWQLSNILEMADSEGEVYIFATSGKGAIGAIGRLCKEYGKQYRQRPGLAPIIELGRDSYIHKEYGKQYVPVFTIVDWADENTLEPIGEADDVPLPLIEEGQNKPPAAAGQRAANPTPQTNGNARAASGNSTTKSPSNKPRF